MAKNTGKPTERAFEAALKRLGKRAFYCRLVDAAEIYGRVGKTSDIIRPQPSDYIVTIDGKTSYNEVKSTQDARAFRFSLLRKQQAGAAERIVAAGGEYIVFVHHLPTDTWYRVPFTVIQAVQAGGSASIPWAEMKDYVWNPNTLM